MLCLVTDGARLAPGGSVDARRGCLVAQAAFAAQAAIDIIQVRERSLEAGALAAIVREILAVIRGSATRVVVNDRLDVALACGAHGVHLRGDSIPLGDARRIAPDGFLVGRSVHSVEDAHAAAHADYLIAGTVFPTPSKPASTAMIGLDGLRQITGAVQVPVLAIGGITELHLAGVARTGAAGVAAIGMFMGAGPTTDITACRAVALDAIAARARREFESQLR